MAQGNIGLPDIGGIGQFDPQGDRNSICIRWTLWMRGYELFLTSKGIDNYEQKKHIAECKNVADALSRLL